MKTLDDLVAFIDLVLAPGFETAAAEARLGKIERWVGELAKVKSSDPALHHSVIETSKKGYSGVQTRPVEPLEVSWDELKRALGEPERDALTVDDWGGPIPYRFTREVSGSRGVVLLYIAGDSAPKARIVEIIARRAR